ncbi:MAG: PepSY-associated TM helix domain-containing protein [Rhodospirillaceae bacterium]|nr:PepSY-associated TM helix domain-containing protein [Rhodospirillaceae bacterium]
MFDRDLRRGWWFTIHKWVGIVAGLWILLLALTGAVIAFHGELRSALEKGLYRTGRCDVVPRFDLMEQAVVKAFPDFDIRRVERENIYCDESYRFIIGEKNSASPISGTLWDTEVFVDPGDGRIIGSRPWLSVVQAAYQFHGFLLTGMAGRQVLGFLGLILLTNVIAGVVVWWPRSGKIALAFRVRWKGRAQVLFRDLHNVAGACAVPVLGLMLVTGLSLTFPEPVQKFLRLFADSQEVEKTATTDRQESRAVLSDLHNEMASITAQHLAAADQGPPKRAGLQAVYDSMEEALPGHVPIRIYYPTGAVGGFFFYVSQGAGGGFSTTVTGYLNPFTARLFFRNDEHQQEVFQWWVNWSFFAHSGKYFGLAGRIVVFVMAVILVGLVATGLYLWLARPIPVPRRSKDRIPSSTSIPSENT